MEPFHSYRGVTPKLMGRRVLAGGYSLVELLVVLAVITIVTMTVLTSQGGFNKSIILTNTAYDLALTLRYTETYGISSRTLQGVAANTGYGLHFSKPMPSNTVTLFADTVPAVSGTVEQPCHKWQIVDPTGPFAAAGDCAYTSDPIVQTITINNGLTIKDFCEYSSGTKTCSFSNGSTLTSLDIVFARPNPNAFITKNGTNVPLTQACITLQSPQSTAAVPSSYRYILVTNSGQISVSTTPCP